jgi:malonate-semialdehyde dehydrogenase (acetylating) / methylmalonate-semialdehyde dehydrogenase
VAPGLDAHARRPPPGVTVGITPHHFPALLPLEMLAPVVGGGGVFVLKPSAKVPSAPVRLAELFLEAGAPPGVLNVLHGDREAVEALITHPLVSAVSYVGSAPVASSLYATATAHGKRVQATGGAKHHHVVMPDADLDRVTDRLMRAAYGSAGEHGMAIAVAVPVGQATADALVARLAERVRALRIGPSLAEGMEMGPLVTDEHHARVTGCIALGVAEGASLVVDGRAFRLGDAPHADGYFLGGSLFDHVTTAMRLYQEELFAPVLCVVRVASLEEALGMDARHAVGSRRRENERTRGREGP